jgi:type I restriction-modification system DNA methylase subunit
LGDLLFALDESKLEDITLFLDIIIYIDSFDFGGLSGDIFGYVYENYLKELYADVNKGQYFTDPAIAELMLSEIGWTVENLQLKIESKDWDSFSIIDPACGSGAFLYTAVKTLVKAAQKSNLEPTQIIKLVVDNVVGFDVEEFPLYLTEMNILMRLLPVIYSDHTTPQPVENRLKIFWTEDSLSEFLDIYSSNKTYESDQNTIFEPIICEQKRFMRDEKELEILKVETLTAKRKKFDYVIANPPYIGYNESSKMGIKYFDKIKSKEVKLNDVYGVNMHSTPDRHKKYSPKPNLYAFFLALNHALLKTGGKFCFIIPQTLLTAGDLDVVRFYLASKFEINLLFTFENNLFINRGVKQTNKIATSSLIVLATKGSNSKHTKILNYESSNDSAIETFINFGQNKNLNKKKILQKELLEKYSNWNWIKHSDQEKLLYSQYQKNSQSIELYYNHDTAEREFGARFWFDKGLVFPKEKIVETISDYQLTRLGKNYGIDYKNQWIDTKSIILPKGSQGLAVFDQKYKIIWSYMNANKFYHSSKNVMISFNQVVISTNSELESKYLFGILNSSLSWKILNLNLSSDHEQALIIGIKSIKNFIRVPNIDTDQKKKWKLELVELAQRLLDCENVELQDLVDFDSDLLLRPQYESWSVHSGNLHLTIGNHTVNFAIKNKSNESEIFETLESIYGKPIVIGDNPILLSDLKKININSTKSQSKIKNQIDGLVLELYEMSEWAEFFWGIKKPQH